MSRWFAICLLGFLLSNCVSPSDKNAVTQAAVHKAEFWENHKLKPLEDRIFLATPEIVQFMREDNARNGFSNIPRTPKDADGFWQDTRAAIQGLPESVKRIASQKLAGIALIEELGGSAYADAIRDAQGRADSGFILLDVKAIDKKANDWASWKENTPFESKPGYSLEVLIENPSENTRVQAIQYILLHELGHVVAIGTNFHPPWFDPSLGEKSVGSYPFTDLSWTRDDKSGRHEHSDKGFLPYCFPIRYYAKSSFPLDKAKECYQGLANSRFVTFYAGTNPFDDFAETFAFYVHHVMMGRPWKIRVLGPGGEYVYSPRWEEKRFDGKRPILEGLLK